MDCSVIRLLFDKLIDKIPQLLPTTSIIIKIEKMDDSSENSNNIIGFKPTINDYLGANANNIHNKDFENGIVKLQLGKSDWLTSEERDQLKQFEENDDTWNEQWQNDNYDHNNEHDFCSDVLKKIEMVKKRHKLNHRKYVNISHVIPTCFRAAMVFNDFGKLSSKHASALFNLKYNHDMWDESTVEEAMKIKDEPPRPRADLETLFHELDSDSDDSY
eukprot:gene16151-21954_t